MNAAAKQASRFWSITRLVFWEADATLIRALLGAASFGWAFTLIWSEVFHLRHIMDRQAYEILRLLGNEWAWALAFILHFFGVTWRTYTIRPCVSCALLVNVYGFFIWTFSTLAINWSIGFVSPTSVLELIICFYAGLAIVKTGLVDEIVTP